MKFNLFVNGKYWNTSIFIVEPACTLFLRFLGGPFVFFHRRSPKKVFSYDKFTVLVPVDALFAFTNPHTRTWHSDCFWLGMVLFPLVVFIAPGERQKEKKQKKIGLNIKVALFNKPCLVLPYDLHLNSFINACWLTPGGPQYPGDTTVSNKLFGVEALPPPFTSFVLTNRCGFFWPFGHQDRGQKVCAKT